MDVETWNDLPTTTPLLVNGDEQEQEVEECPPLRNNGHDDDDNNNNINNNNNNDLPEFSVANEIVEMVHLGWPLMISFFCRMGMASTDSAFVGHIHDEHHTAETYLAAAVLSDMCVSVFLTPPLAFNQVLNALVGQAVGSGNPRMAGVWLQQSMFWLTVTMLPSLTALWFVSPCLTALGFPSDVAAVAGTYARYNAPWPVPNGLYQCMRFYFQAQGLPRPAMYNNLLFLVVNAALNWVFVLGGPFRYATESSTWHWKGLGFIGAAVSLSISRTLQSVVYFLYMFVYRKHHRNTWPETSTTTTPGRGRDGWGWLRHHTRARTMEFLKQSVPNIGTLLFQVLAGQATTVLLGRLGELSIAASSALSTVTIPWSGSLSATCTTISGVRVGHHLGRGHAYAAQRSTWLVLYFITAVNVVVAIMFWGLGHTVLDVATNDASVLRLAAKVIPAMLVGTYLNTMVSNITSGVFSGMGRPLLATILSFGLELPLTLGGVAVYILVFNGNLVGVYWWQALAGAIELIIVVIILWRSDWQKCVDDTRRRQEAGRSNDQNDDDDDSNNNNSNNNADETTIIVEPSSLDEDNQEEDEEEPLLTTAIEEPQR